MHFLSLQKFRDQAQIVTTKSVALLLDNPSVSVPCKGEQRRLASLAHVIHDKNY